MPVQVHRGRTHASLLFALLGPTLVLVAVGTTYTYQGPSDDVLSDTHGSPPELATFWFSKRCGACHSLMKNRAAGRGPSLAEIGEVAATRVPELTAEEYLLESILHPDKFKTPGFRGGMPADIAAGIDEQGLRALVHFLMLQGGTTDAETIAQLDVAPLEPRELPQPSAERLAIERGLEVYQTKAGCIKCHPLAPLPGFELLAPRIHGAGLLGEPQLHEAVFEPSKHILPGYEQVMVIFPDGTSTKGRLLERTDRHITMLGTAQGKWTPETIALAPGEGGESPEVITDPLSAMPGNYAEILSQQEQADLLAFLRTLVSRQ